jgi:DNA-binding transcriptional LysR family regulator
LILTTRQLQAFQLVAKLGNFSRAAERMFITPAGLSLLMRELESQLGFRLFDRDTRQVALTEAGTALLPVVAQGMDRIHSTVAELARGAREKAQVLHVGATPLIAAHLLPRAIARFALDTPSLSIRLHDGERAQVVEMVRAGTLDLAVGMFFPKPVAGIDRVALHRFQLCVIRSTRDDAPRGPTVRWRDVEIDRLIQLPSDNPIQRLISTHLGRVGQRAPSSMVQNMLDTLIGMAEAGLGIAIVPSFVLPACRQRDVTMIPLVDPIATLDLFIIKSRGRPLTPVAGAFVDHVKQSIGEWTADFATRPPKKKRTRRPE